MNSPLKNNFVGFDHSSKDKPPEDPKADVEKEFDEGINAKSLVDSLPNHLAYCEICNQQFRTKKDLRTHILIHLGKPRVLLKRIPNLKPIKKKHNSRYRLDPEKRGSLKLTLKKQISTDSLKLTLKKSSKSEDFTVVNSNLDSENYYKEDVAGSGANDPNDGKEAEKEANEPFENVTVNQQQETYGSNDFETEERIDPLDVNERPSVDASEGDSGVGSDTVNAPEREDQILDDLPSTENFENSESVLPEIEDHEESDALEATCRETIENLRKLGEDSRPANSVPIVNPTSESETTTMIEQLSENSAISIIPKSSIYPTQSPNQPSPSESQKESSESPGTNSSFNWSQLTEKNSESSNKDTEQAVENTDNHAESGSLLQNFLLEHQRRNQNETSLSNNLPPGETEYVSLERLAETVNTCPVCNEKFKDIAQLDEHRANAGHFQCNVTDCMNLIFNSPMEVAIHKVQVHGAPNSPSVSQMSPPVSTSSPNLNRNSPHLNSNSPHLIVNSPHSSNPAQLSRNSPLTSPHQTGSPPFTSSTNAKQQLTPPVNFEQLPAPVQQLAQQVQRMPLPQNQIPPTLPPGANTMIPATNYFGQPAGRPPMYRVPGPQGMHFPPHLAAHLYSQYGTGPYPQMPGAPPMHPQMPQQMQQMPRGRYPVMQNARALRMPQAGPPPRQRMKRPIQQPMPPQQQQSSPSAKQRRMEMPERNDDADCHVIAQQKRTDGLPVIQSVQGGVTQQAARNDSTIHLTDSITLSVRQPGSAPAPVQTTVGPNGKKPDAKAVANVLAARGITVTPAANKNKGSEQNKQLPQQQQRAPPPPQPANVTSLNLNSAISIIPASSQRKQQQEQQNQFAVPQNRQNKQPNSDVERPPRPPTVDLTQDGPPLPPTAVRRGRPPRAMLTCQVCDKTFQNQEMLTQHMASHRATSKLLHKCNLCPAQYPTAQALATHKQAYHKEVDNSLQNGGAELALPVVDLKSPQVLSRLSSLGIQNYIPLSQLSAQTGGYFGLPIVTIDGARNPNTCNLAALGATSILSLGPLKHLPPR